MSINLFSQIPARATAQIAQFTDEPQTLRNVCQTYRYQLEKTESYKTAISEGVCSSVSYSSEKAKDLSDAIRRTKIPFAVYSDDPVLKAGIERILQLLYSKKYLLSGKEAYSLVLDGFARITGPATYGQVRVGTKPLDDDIEGQYNAHEYTLMLNERSVQSLGIKTLEKLEEMIQGAGKGDWFKTRLINLMSTIIHEMTHAVHHATFKSFTDAHDAPLKEELECTVEEYTVALKKAASHIPEEISKGRLLFPFTLANQMRPDFLEPARFVRLNKLEIAFAEFLARIPEMYCKFSSSHSREEIGAALYEIFPLGHRVFWKHFKKKCEELRVAPLSEDALGDLADSPRRLFSVLGQTTSPELWKMGCNATIASDRIPWVIYRDKDPMLLLQKGNELQKYDVEKTLERGCHCLTYIEPGRLAFSTKFLETFEVLSKKTDELSLAKLQRMLKHLAQEMDSSFRKDAQKDARRNKIPQISGWGILPYQRDYAKRLFQKVYEFYKSPYYRDIGKDSHSEILAVFARLARASDEDNVPYGHHVCVTLVHPPTDSCSWGKVASDRGLKECLEKGCHFYISYDYTNYSTDKSPTLGISTKFLDTFYRLYSEAEQSGTESKALREILGQVIDEMREAVRHFRRKAPSHLVDEFGGMLISSDYFRAKNTFKPKLREKSDFKKRG